MEWVQIIVSALGGGLMTVLGSILYFRPKLKEAQASAKIAETEAEKKNHDYLLERIESMERLFNEQGLALDKLRMSMITLSEEKQRSDERVFQLEAENRTLKHKVECLEHEISTYRQTKVKNK